MAAAACPAYTPYALSLCIPQHSLCIRHTYSHDTLRHCALHVQMDWLCPSYNALLHTQLEASWGALTPEATIANVLPIVQTGDVHAAVYDLTAQQLYVSFYVTNSSSVPMPLNAYDRAFTKLDLGALFAHTQ